MANDKFYIISDNQIGITITDAADVEVTDATVTVSVFDNTQLACSSSNSPTRDVQTLTPDAIASAGTFMLGYHGDWTAALNYNESLENIKTALEGLDGIGAGKIVVSGKQLSDADFANGMVFTFGRNFGEAFRIDFDFSSTTGPTQNGSTIAQTTKGVSQGVALDLGGGQVGIPTANVPDVYPGMFIRIIGTRNCDGQYEVDPLLSSRSLLAITATFVYERFDGTELIYLGKPNGDDIAMTYDTDGYYGITPSNLAGFVKNETACIFVEAVSGAITRVFNALPKVQF